MTIKSKSYEECREDFFVNLIKHAENKIKYWKRQTGYRCELADNLSQSGAEIQYCLDALAALEKQIQKKPVHIHEEYEKHDWQKDEDGNVDEFAFEWDDHTGVACTRCCTTYCVYCDPDYDEKGDKCIIDYNKCPNCGRKVTKSEKYCDDCGQALDWSDESK